MFDAYETCFDLAYIGISGDDGYTIRYVDECLLKKGVDVVQRVFVLFVDRFVLLLGYLFEQLFLVQRSGC